jgi:tetratricopeptide (TPR) repeat protein
MSDLETDRLARLLGYIVQDPDNLRLIADAANVAFDARDPVTATRLISDYAARANLTPQLLNLQGMIALQTGDHSAAVKLFSELIKDHDAPDLRFNLAWSYAMMGDHAAALDELSDNVVTNVPRAAALKVQMLHHLGAVEDALAVGQGLAELYPENSDLFGALSVAAMDADDITLSEHYAQNAGSSPDGLTSLGLIKLNEDSPELAITFFDQALAGHPKAPRAWLGKGLSLLSIGQPREAAHHIDTGAELFGDHIGSWIASGWAHFINHDLLAARASFERACALDDNFAESHGSLAVVALAEQQIDSARRSAAVAIRLDRNCFSGALAKSLIAEIDGNPALGKRILDRAINMPAGPDGKTIAQAMVGIGIGKGLSRR